jgi:hypothetical protein
MSITFAGPDEADIIRQERLFERAERVRGAGTLAAK